MNYTLTPEQIQEEWKQFLAYITQYIEEPRRTFLIDFYKSHEERLILYPASHKRDYHNAFPGGYIEHVNRVVRCSLKLYSLWIDEGTIQDGFSLEELVFSAINHDLGKIGTETEEAYVPQQDQWRKDKLGEDYMFNDKIPFSSVPDRSLYILQSNGIRYSFNEMIAILTHDGLYDDSNKKYLVNYKPEQKPRNSLPYILHQADLMASRIEYEREYYNNGRWEFDSTKFVKDKQNNNNFSLKQENKNTLPTKSRALKTIENPKFKDIFDKL